MPSTGSPAFQALAAVIARGAAPLVPATRTLDGLAAASEARPTAKGEHLLRVGEPAGHVFFVVRGLLRYYYLDADGSERTGQFFDAGAMITDVASFVSGAAATSQSRRSRAAKPCGCRAPRSGPPTPRTPRPSASGG